MDAPRRPSELALAAWLVLAVWTLLASAASLRPRLGDSAAACVAFAAAAGTLFGRDTVEGPMFHLWHPPIGKRREMIDRNASLVRRYTTADDDPVAMRRVLARPRRYRWR